MSESNGTPVTWREFNLAIAPMKDDLKEVKADVKILLAAHSGDEAVGAWQRWFFGAVLALAMVAIATLTWLATG